jgi:hypothetical protein
VPEAGANPAADYVPRGFVPAGGRRRLPPFIVNIFWKKY